MEVVKLYLETFKDSQVSKILGVKDSSTKGFTFFENLKSKEECKDIYILLGKMLNSCKNKENIDRIEIHTTRVDIYTYVSNLLKADDVYIPFDVDHAYFLRALKKKFELVQIKLSNSKKPNIITSTIQERITNW